MLFLKTDHFKNFRLLCELGEHDIDNLQHILSPLRSIFIKI